MRRPIVLALVVAAGAWVGSEARAEPQRLGLRIVTYNVTNLQTYTPAWRVRELADDLERLDADVVFLQEVASVNAARVLQRELANRPIAPYQLYQLQNPWSDQEVILLTRRPPTAFRRYDFSYLSSGLDRVAWAEFDLPGGRLRAVAVHLKAGIQDGDAARTRNYQVRELLDDVIRPALAAGTYCALLGDFNDIDRAVRYAYSRTPDPESRVFETIRALAPGLRNTDAELPVRERVTSSLGYMYDHFVVDERLAARVFVDRASTQDGVIPSDHWPLVLDLHPLGARPVRLAATAPRTVPVGGAALDTLQVAASGQVLTEVSVRVVASHHRPYDLEVRLTHGGRTATLIREGAESSRSIDRRLFTRAFDGLPAAGAWTLEVRDRGAGSSSGTLSSWELHTAAR